MQLPSSKSAHPTPSSQSGQVEPQTRVFEQSRGRQVGEA